MMRTFLLVSFFIYKANTQFQNTSSAFEVETSYIDGEISEEDEKHVVDSIDEICMLFNLSTENCTCEVVSAYIPDGLPMCTSSNELVYDPTTSSVYATVTIIASLVGGFGNFGILVVAYKQRNGLPRSNVLFAQLAIVDFTFAVIQTIVVIPLFRTNRWVFGPFFCKFFRAAMAMGGHLTIGFILNITIERFLGIIYPLKTKRTSKKTTFCLTISNIVAGFLTITPLLAVLRIDRDDGRCIEHWDDFSANVSVYNWFLLIVYFLIPVIIIFALYGRIIKHLKGQEKINNSLYIESERQKKLKRNQRIMYIIVSILIAFIVCILPNRAIWIYLDYRKNKIDHRLYMILSFISYVSYPFHVAFNPIIYSMIDKNWRRDIVNVFCCRKVGNYRMSKSSTATIQTSSITSQDLRTSMMRTKLSIISDKDWESRTHLMVCREGQRNKEECTTI